MLLFADDNVVTAALEQALAALGNPVIRIASGTEFARDGEQRFRIAPGEPQHYEQVLQALASAPVAAAIHACNLTERSTLGKENVDAHAERAFYSLLHLVQALSDASFEGRLPLLTLSNEVHARRAGASWWSCPPHSGQAARRFLPDRSQGDVLDRHPGAEAAGGCGGANMSAGHEITKGVHEG